MERVSEQIIKKTFPFDSVKNFMDRQDNQRQCDEYFF